MSKQLEAAKRLAERGLELQHGAATAIAHRHARGVLALVKVAEASEGVRRSLPAGR